MVTNGLDQVSAFEQTHFDDATITVAPHKFDLNALLPRTGLTTAQIIALSGAPSGHTVELMWLDKAYWAKQPDGDRTPTGLYFKVTGPWIAQGQRHLVCIFKQGGWPCLYIKDIFFDANKCPKGLAGTMVKRMVRTATLMNFNSIQLLAAGGRYCPGVPNANGLRYGGYAAWPKYGFDMPLDKNNRALVQYFPHYPPKLSSCNTVQDLLALPGGPEYWKANGDGNFMKFTLKSTGAVRKLLRALNE